MIAHSEYCANGDNTLAALSVARQSIVKEEADDYFVFLVSDANLDRYDIKPGFYHSIAITIIDYDYDDIHFPFSISIFHFLFSRIFSIFDFVFRNYFPDLFLSFYTC